MSNPMDAQDDDRPTVVGTDPDMNIGDEDPGGAQRADEATEQEDDAEHDEVAIEDLP